MSLLRNCNLHLCKYLLMLGCQNVSKEILITLLKFQWQVPSHSRDIKIFHSGRGCKFPSTYEVLGDSKS